MSVYLLGIPAISYRFIFIVLQKDVPKTSVWHILYYVPFYRKAASPFVLLPEIHILVEVNGANHFSNTTELSTRINLHRNQILLS